MSCHVYVQVDAGNGFANVNFDIPQIFGVATAFVQEALGFEERYQDAMQKGTAGEWRFVMRAAFVRMVTDRDGVCEECKRWDFEATDAAESFLRACLIASIQYPKARFYFSC